MNEPQHKDTTKLCKACNQWFELNGSQTSGQWVNGWFQFNCPHCKTLLATQTPWFEIYPLTNYLDRLNDGTDKIST